MTSTMSTSSSTTRVPFGEISGARLQNLQSLKNRQNALSSPASTLKSSTKRSIEIFNDDSDPDTENIDPASYSSPSKRSKGLDQDFIKPRIILKKPSSTSHSTSTLSSPINTTSNRPIAKTRTPRTSPTMCATMTMTTTQTLSAPAGRSPQRKRTGLINRRSTIQRVEPPSFTLSSQQSAAAPFSIASALSGTLSSYRSKMLPPSVTKKVTRPSWDFVIHEDTLEEEAQIIMEHRSNTLDLSSEEDKKKRDDSENKENIAPDDDVSQTGLRLRGGRSAGKGDMECDRKVLGEVAVSDLYDDLEAKILVLDDEEFEESEVKIVVTESVTGSNTKACDETKLDVEEDKKEKAGVQKRSHAECEDDN